MPRDLGAEPRGELFREASARGVAERATAAEPEQRLWASQAIAERVDGRSERVAAAESLLIEAALAELHIAPAAVAPDLDRANLAPALTGHARDPREGLIPARGSEPAIGRAGEAMEERPGAPDRREAGGHARRTVGRTRGER